MWVRLPPLALRFGRARASLGTPSGPPTVLWRASSVFPFLVRSPILTLIAGKFLHLATVDVVLLNGLHVYAGEIVR